jgi:hypothetical protein
MGIAGSDEIFKQRMGFQRLGFELGMELATEKPGMVLDLDDFDKPVIRVLSREKKAGSRQYRLVLGVEFVAMAVALINITFPIGFVGKRFLF